MAEKTVFRFHALLGFAGKRPIHAVIAANAAENTLIVITVYEPDPSQWDKKFERRKKK